MYQNEYNKMYDMESKSWYFVSKRFYIKNLMRKLDLPQKPKFLDIGCGTGINIKEFYSKHDYLGVDLNPEAIEFCKKRGLNNIVQQDINNLDLPKNEFDCVSTFDVLYHKNVKMDAALKKIHSSLKPGGYLIITDSALEFLKSEHDVVMEARERFNKKSLEKYLKEADLEPVYTSYAFFFLFPIIATVRILKKFLLIFKKNDPTKLDSDVKPIHPVLNKTLIGVNYLESVLKRKVKMPIGSTIVCVAQKRSDTTH